MLPLPRPACALVAALLWAPAPGAAPARRALLDRHGHALAHAPPLERDGACAPELYGAALRAGLLAAGDGNVPTRLDGALQALARRVVEQGALRLARQVPPQGERPAASPAVGQRLTGTVRAVAADHAEIELGSPGWLGQLPLPGAACPGHTLSSAPPPLRSGDRLRLRVVELLPPAGAGLPRRARLAPQPQAALVALDPRSRDVLALVGGHGLRPGDFDRASQGRRQAGSTWKPLVYAAALGSRRVHADDVVEDLPRLFGDWQPRNFGGTYRGSLRLQEALWHSVNTVAVRLLAEVGPGAVAALADRMGIPAAQVPRDLTQALGTALVSPLQLAGAYAVFADGGRYVPPRIFDGAGAAEEREPPLSPALAHLMTDLLRGVLTEGTGARARDLGLPHLSGKTGTTSLGNDAWFVGYHGALLAVVWVGDDADATPSDRTGADTALPLWMDFMRDAARAGYRPLPEAAALPPGLVEVPLAAGGRALRLADTP